MCMILWLWPVSWALFAASLGYSPETSKWVERNPGFCLAVFFLGPMILLGGAAYGVGHALRKKIYEKKSI